MNAVPFDPSLSPLLALLSQAERERDNAQAQVQRSLAAHRAAQAQVEQLLAYRLDYEARYRERFSRQNGVDVFQSYQTFMARLTLAVEQQQQVVANAERRVEQAQAVLRDHEMKVASVRKLIERRTAELRLAGERRAQKQTDEFASRAAWNRLNEQQLSH